MTPNEKYDDFLEWCYYNDDIPIVRGYLGSLDCMNALDKHGTPKRLYNAAIDIRNYLEKKISEFKGDSG